MKQTRVIVRIMVDCPSSLTKTAVVLCIVLSWETLALCTMVAGFVRHYCITQVNIRQHLHCVPISTLVSVNVFSDPKIVQQSGHNLLYKPTN